MCLIVLLKARPCLEEPAEQKDQQQRQELHINKGHTCMDRSLNQKTNSNNYLYDHLFDLYFEIYSIKFCQSFQIYQNYIMKNSKVSNLYEIDDGDSIDQNQDEKSYLKRKNYDGSLQNGEITNFYFKKSKEIQISLSIIIVINIYFIILINQLTYPQLKSQDQSIINISLYFSIICVIIALILVTMRSLNLLKLEKQQKKIYKKENIYSTNKILYLICEWIILLVQPYPFLVGINIETQNSFKDYSIKYPINDLISIFSFARVYIILRSALLMTPYMSNRTQRLCKMYGCQVDYSYALKCLFKEHPLKLICVMYSATALIFAYLIYIAQRQLSNQINASFNPVVYQAATQYFNALWLILITTTTVGYGDYFPQTPLGRIIIVFVAIWGTLIVSIMVVVVSNTLNMEKNQIKTQKILNKLQLRSQLQQKAGKFVGYFMMYFLSKNRIKLGTDIKKKFLESKKEFVIIKRIIRQRTEDDDLQDQISTHFLKLNSDIDILNSNQDKILDFIHDNFNKNAVLPTNQIHTQDVMKQEMISEFSDQLSQSSQEELIATETKEKIKYQ